MELGCESLEYGHENVAEPQECLPADVPQQEERPKEGELRDKIDTSRL